MRTATISVDSTAVAVHVAYDEAILAVLKRVPGARWQSDRHAWYYPRSAWIVWELVDKLTPLIPVNLTPQAEALLDKARRALQARAELEQAVFPFCPVEGKTKPWQHQVRGFRFVQTLWGKEGGAAALWWEMAAGKSRVAIDLIQAYQFQRTLILCPKHVMEVWPQQFAEHALNPPEVYVLDQVRVSDRALHLQRLLSGDRRVVFVVNQEGVWREPLASAVRKAQFQCLISDEHHRLKAHQGKAAVFVAQLAHTIPFVLALSGTPIPHSPLDVFQQYKILDPGIFGPYFTRFKEQYAVIGGYRVNGRPVQVVGWQNLADLQARMQRIAYRIETRDVLDLPPEMDIVHTCTLTEETRRVYDTLAKEFVAEVESGLITAANALVKLLRLQQVTSGYVTLDDGRQVRLGSEKAELLEDILTDLSPEEPIVVFCRFWHDLDRVREVAQRLGRTVSELSGRKDELAAWQAGESNVLAAQIATGGLGISLVRAHYCIFYSTGFSLAEYLQARARLARPGQAYPVRYLHLVAKHTVDAQVYSALRKRKDVVEAILRDARQLALDTV